MGRKTKKVLYIGHLGNRSYGDEIGLYLFKDYIVNHPNITVDSINIRVGDTVAISNAHDFYLLGCGTCVSNMGRLYADQILIQLSNSSKPYGVLGAGVYFDTGSKQKKQVFKPTSTVTAATRKFIDKASHFLVRDDASYNALKSLSSSKNIRVVGDPGLAVRYPKIPMRFKKRVLGYNICGSSPGCLGYMNVSPKTTDNVLNFIKSKSGEYNLMYVPFNVKDAKLAKSRKLGNYSTVGPWGTPKRIAGILQNADLFVGMRVHSDVTCTAYSIPFFSIGYTWPNINFLDHIEHKYRTNIATQGTAVPDLEAGFNDLVKNQDIVKTKLKEKSDWALTTYNREVEELCQTILNS
jgi:hypothetical protein